ncbi:molybdopterin-dependent oxidoreductase [Chloroflexota bacterium]
MKESGERVVTTSCASHCGGTCMIKVHVKDGVITRVETDDGEEPQLRACWRGRAYRQRVYAPDRLKFPMKRVGERREGKFERISWDEALDTVAKELIRVRDTYGPASTVLIRGAGDQCQVHNSRYLHILLCRLGGYTGAWGAPSFQAGIHAVQATYGTWRTSNGRDDLLNSRLIILWGWNPVSTICGTNTCWYLAQARERGARVVAVDPQYTNTAAIFADQWIPIRPGTDAAMLIAMAYIIIKENLQDQAFLDKYTVGFDHFEDYVLGIDDGEAKTPAWAEKISGVPAATIESLAREYATTKPAALMAGIAPGRTAYGEQHHRATATLAAMTGNIGIHGGDAAGRAWEAPGWYPYKMASRTAPRPGEPVNPLKPIVTDGRSPTYIPTQVHYTHLPDVILGEKVAGYSANIKLACVINKNYVNQFPNVNKIVRALKRLEFIVVFEQFMTATAKFADILLPTTTFMERNDINHGVGIPFYGFVNKAIEPVDECKSHLEIARELAARLGITDLVDETEDKRTREDVAASEIPDYEEFKEKGVYKIKLDEPYVAFKKQIEDSVNNPFTTPSGKIEIYSQKWADKNDPKLPPVAKYIETWESLNDPLARKYPLQLITTHFWRRAHTQFDNIPWLRELDPQRITLNSADADARGIKDGDMVKVFNDRGMMVLPAKVTERIMPGVVDIPQGAWYKPDDKGVDRGGCANVLSKDETSPGGGYPYNTGLVQVQKD